LFSARSAPSGDSLRALERILNFAPKVRNISAQGKRSAALGKYPPIRFALKGQNTWHALTGLSLPLV
jgi:hypothetical protein